MYLMNYLDKTNKIEEFTCCNCWDIISGLNKSKGAEFFRIDSKLYCGLECYFEYKDNYKEKKVKKVKKCRKKSKKR